MIPFGETTILNDGRRVSAVWQARGIYLGTTFHDGPELRMPDAALTPSGKVWVGGRLQSTNHAVVWLDAVGLWWSVPYGLYGSRTILRADGEGCRIAFSSSATTWICIAVTPGGSMTIAETGTIPLGDGAEGMRDWTGIGHPRPMSPLDQPLLGHQVRAAVTAGSTTIASASADLPDQVVVARGMALGTLHLGGIDWPTPRLSPNEKWWVGVKYVGQQVVGGAVPGAVPPLQAGPTPPPYRPVAPVGRAAYIGFFNHHPPPTPYPLPGACSIDVYDHHFLRRLSDGAILGRFVAGSPESSLSALNAAIAKSRADFHGCPVLAYWTRGLWSGPLPTGATWLAVEAYQRVGESDAEFLAAIDAQAAKHPKPWYLGQCYTSNATLTAELTHLPSRYSEAMKARPSVIGTIGFSGFNRDTGYMQHPEVHAPWTDLSHAVTGVPALPAWTPPQPKPPDPPQPPMPLRSPFGLMTWQKKFITAENGGDDAGTLHAIDRDQSQRVGPWETFTLVPQDTDVYAIRTDNGRYWCAEGGGGSIVHANRTAIGGWELFHIIVNDDGTWSLRTRDNGLYVTCETDGTINANRSAIGPWEKFVNSPPGAAIPQPPHPVEPGEAIPAVHPDGHIFRLADGTPWRYKGVTAFMLLQLWIDGGDVAGFLNAYPGYNTVRVFSYVEGPNWTDPTWEPPTPDQAVAFATLLNSLGWRMEFVPLTSSNPARRARAIEIINALAAAKLTNIFLEAANEPEVQNPDKTFIDATELRPALEASGYPFSNGCYTDGAKRHWGTYITQHGQRDSEWPRRCHDAYDLWVKPADAPAGAQAVHKPCLLDEPAKPEDVGGNKVIDWKGYFGGAAIFAAGATFHSKTGKFAQLPTAEERTLAAAALMGLNAYPADAANAQSTYRRIDGDGLRTYVIGNAMVRIRPNKPEAPEPGWTSLETDHILWKR